MKTKTARDYIRWVDAEVQKLERGETRPGVFVHMVKGNPALEAFAIGSSHLADMGTTIPPLFSARDGRVMARVQGCMVDFPFCLEAGAGAIIENHRDYLEFMKTEADAASSARDYFRFFRIRYALADFVCAFRQAEQQETGYEI